MKIRILDNSLRLRISQKELTQLFEKGKISNRTDFSNNNFFSCSIISSSITEALLAEYENNEIKVIIPSSKIEVLHNTDLIGLENTVSDLKVLVEKDFKCLTERDEDESELFDNPNKDKLNC